MTYEEMDDIRMILVNANRCLTQLERDMADLGFSDMPENIMTKKRICSIGTMAMGLQVDITKAMNELTKIKTED